MDVIISNKEGVLSDVLCFFAFWEKDRLQVYESIYDGILTVFSKVGGAYKIIMGVLSIINIILSDNAEFKDAKALYKREIINNNINNNIYNDINHSFNDNIKNSIKNSKLYKSSTKDTKELISSTSIPQVKSKKKLVKKLKEIDIGICKFLFVKFFNCCISEKQKECLTFLELKREILSVEFMYSLYFNKNHLDFPYLDNANRIFENKKQKDKNKKVVHFDYVHNIDEISNNSIKRNISKSDYSI